MSETSWSCRVIVVNEQQRVWHCQEPEGVEVCKEV